MVKQDKITLETEVNTSELACVLGITGRRVRQLVEDGVLEKISTGCFLLCKSVQAFVAGVNQKSKPTKTDEDRAEAEVSLKKAKAIKAVLEAKELQGKMHRSEDVEAITGDLILFMRDRLSALPGRLAVDVAEVDNPAKVAEIIKNEVYKIMEEMSHYKYDPAEYAERVRERQNWESSMNNDEKE